MKNYKIPIIIIHKGDSKYLPASLLQLRHSNPETPVYLLGDDGNKHYKHLVSHFAINDFFETAVEFEKIYSHYSTNGYEFELICIQRWFVLNDFMKQQQITQCIYLDSDVLVYGDMIKLQQDLSSYSMTVSGISAHTNFINDRQVLSDFCQFVWQAYMNEKVTETLRKRYEAFLNIHPAGGISDMTFFTDYRKAYPEKILNISEPRNNGVFDITLDTIHDYESEGGYKKIIWKGKVPYAMHLGLNEYCQFYTLHFQGKCKNKIYDYVTYSFPDKLNSFLLLVSYYKNKIVRKLLR